MDWGGSQCEDWKKRKRPEREEEEEEEESGEKSGRKRTAHSSKTGTTETTLHTSCRLSIFADLTTILSTVTRCLSSRPRQKVQVMVSRLTF